MAHPSLAQRPSGDLAAPDRLSPSRRLLWDTLESSMRERWEHSRLPDLHPTEVQEAMLAPTRPMVGGHETFAQMKGPPLERPWAGFGSTVDPGSVRVRPNRDEQEPGEKVDHGDGTWSRGRQDGVAEGQLRWMGPVLYRFEGQIRYSTQSKRSGWHWQEPEKGRDDLSPRGQILGSTRTDTHGGQWLAVNVDERAVARMVAAYDLAMALATGEEEPEEPEQFEDYEDEGGWSRTLTRWTKQWCDTSGDNCDKCELMDGADNRQWITERTDSPTERQKATAMLALDWSGDRAADSYHPGCGGVFLSPWTILTAAHCVWDHATNSPMESANVRVCSQGAAFPASACSEISGDISIPSDFSSGDPRQDYAIIHANPTADSFAESHTNMFMTRAKDRWVTKHRMYNVATPYYYSPSNACATNERPAYDRFRSGLVEWGADMVFSRGDIKSRSGQFKLFFSACTTHSGSPIYYCGDHRCDTGEHGKVVSLISTAPGGRKGIRGPKVRKFRTWALVQIIF